MYVEPKYEHVDEAYQFDRRVRIFWLMFKSPTSLLLCLLSMTSRDSIQHLLRPPPSPRGMRQRFAPKAQGARDVHVGRKGFAERTGGCMKIWPGERVPVPPALRGVIIIASRGCGVLTAALYDMDLDVQHGTDIEACFAVWQVTHGLIRFHPLPHPVQSLWFWRSDRHWNISFLVRGR